MHLTKAKNRPIRHHSLMKYVYKKSKPVAKRHHMVSGILEALCDVFWLSLGCSGAAAPIGDKAL
jgi:hypothetical protein